MNNYARLKDTAVPLRSLGAFADASVGAEAGIRSLEPLAHTVMTSVAGVRIDAMGSVFEGRLARLAQMNDTFEAATTPVVVKTEQPKVDIAAEAKRPGTTVTTFRGKVPTLDM